MKATKRNTVIRAYNNAVYSELQKKGQAPKQALRTIKHYSRPLRQTWGFELNPEAFADEMIKLQKIRTQPQGNTVTIQPHFRTGKNGEFQYVYRHKGAHKVLANSKVQFKFDEDTGKVSIVRAKA